MKTCRKCNIDKEDTEYYKNHIKCKICYNIKRKNKYVKKNKTKIIDKLGYDKLNNIVSDLQAGELNKYNISKKYNIPKSTFFDWLKTEKLVY